MSLGIFCRLFTLFENACRFLDKKSQEQEAQELLQRREKARRLEEKASLFMQHLTWFCLTISESDEDSRRVNQMKAEVALLEKKAKAIVKSDLKNTFCFN